MQKTDYDLDRNALIGFVGTGDPGQLRQLEPRVRAEPAPLADKITVLNGIHALLATQTTAAPQDEALAGTQTTAATGSQPDQSETYRRASEWVTAALDQPAAAPRSRSTSPTKVGL